MRTIYIDMHFEVADNLGMEARDKLLQVMKHYELISRKYIALRAESNGFNPDEFRITRVHSYYGHQRKWTEHVTDSHIFKFLDTGDIHGVPAEVRELAKRVRRVVEAAQRSERLDALLDRPVQLILSDPA